MRFYRTAIRTADAAGNLRRRPLLPWPTHSDEKNQKTTYVTLLGIEQAQKKVEELSNEAIALLHQFTGENAYLEQLLIQLIHRDR